MEKSLNVIFPEIKDTLKESVANAITSNDTQNLVRTQKEISASDADKRLALEQAIRENFLIIWSSNPDDVENLLRIVKMVMGLAQKEMLTPLFSVTILSDMFDTATVSVAEKLFSFVQESLPIWKSDSFFSSCKNSILRMCNDLLRRLPRSQNTQFCGQVLLFLAQFFPFSERSGLNIISEFNSENVTKINKDQELNLEGDLTTEIIPKDLVSKVDNDFYVKFWSIQDFFHNPNSCYDENKWKDFEENSNMILKLLSNSKVQSIVNKSNKSVDVSCRSYYQKNLTSPKLLLFQLNDTNFRRVLYVQYLILFQYLRSVVKSRPEYYVLKQEQQDWIKSSTTIIQKLCKESGTDGQKFLKSIVKVLEREEHWNKWKNESCPTVKKKVVPQGQMTKEQQTVTVASEGKRLGDIYAESKITGKLISQKQGVKQEWILKNDFLSKCRTFTNHPNLKKRIDDILQEADPAAAIEQKFKRVSDMKYIWQTLKLYHQKGSPRCFTSPLQAASNKIPEYIEHLSKQLSRDLAFRAIQARIKKQAGELKARQADLMKKSKEEDEKQGKLANSNTGVTASEIYSKQQKMEVDEDEDAVEVVGDEGELEGGGQDESPPTSDDSNDNADVMEQQAVTQNGLTREQSAEEDRFDKEGFNEIATEITTDWEKVAEKLGYKPDEIEFFATYSPVDFEKAHNMLKVWYSNEQDATPEKLHNSLKELNLDEAAKFAEKYLTLV